MEMCVETVYYIQFLTCCNFVLLLFPLLFSSQCYDDCLIIFQILGEGFLQWLEKELQEPGEAEKTIRPRFPHLWAKYLSDTKQTDKIPFKFKEHHGAAND